MESEPTDFKIVEGNDFRVDIANVTPENIQPGTKIRIGFTSLIEPVEFKAFLDDFEVEVEPDLYAVWITIPENFKEETKLKLYLNNLLLEKDLFIGGQESTAESDKFWLLDNRLSIILIAIILVLGVGIWLYKRKQEIWDRG